MYSEMVRAICRIGIFIVCAQVLVQIRPDASYEKYFKMLVSAMILLQVLQPLGSMLQRGSGSLTQQAAQFREQLHEHMQEAEESREQAEKLREQMTLEELRRRVEERRAAEEEAESGAAEGDRRNEENTKEGTDGDLTESVFRISTVDRIQVEIDGEGGRNERKVE